MTLKQYYKKIDIARKTRYAILPDAVLYCHQITPYRIEWSLKSIDGNTIDTAYDPKKFSYICD